VPSNSQEHKKIQEVAQSTLAGIIDNAIRKAEIAFNVKIYSEGEYQDWLSRTTPTPLQLMSGKQKDT
jgi:hypothetical protein